MNNILGNKALYKIFLIYTKYGSYIYALIQLLGLILYKFNIVISVLSHLGGCSIITLCLLFLSSFVFKFCLTHRIPLYYIMSIYVIEIIDKLLFIEPILKIYLIISGIFILLYIYMWFKYKNVPKIDHIKQLCESYAECNCK